MKISTKLTVATFIILVFTLGFSVFVFFTSQEYNQSSAESVKFDKMVLAITDFRGASRQMIVEAYQSLFLTNGKNRVSFNSAIQNTKEKLEKLEKTGITKVDWSETQTEIPTKTLNAHFSELTKQLNHNLDLLSKGDLQHARISMENTIEIYFKKEYLAIITSLLKSTEASSKSIQ